MFVPNEFRVDYLEAMKILNNDITWKDLIKIDFAYHNEENDYDGGLSFLDRLNKKIGRFHQEWDIEGLKHIIRNANDPFSMYEDIIKYMLEDPRDVNYYNYQLQDPPNPD